MPFILQMYVNVKALHATSYFAKGSSLGIAIACIAVFVVIVIGIIVLRKRTQRVPVSHGFVEVCSSFFSCEAKATQKSEIVDRRIQLIHWIVKRTPRINISVGSSIERKIRSPFLSAVL